MSGRYRYGFGYGRRRANLVPLATTALASSVTQHGITYTFSEARPVFDYANGDKGVLGPVSITSITPAGAVQASGTDGNGGGYVNRVVHGTMVNPGNRSFAVGGLLANNTTNTVQGWDGLNAIGGVVGVAYSAGANVDPGATSVPLNVATGSVVKFVSRLSSLPVNNRPVGDDMAVLTVVDAIPFAGAIRPGVSRTGKASSIRRAQFNLSVLQNLAPTASAPTYAQALDWVDRYHETSQPDTINNANAKAANNQAEYGRDIANNLNRALLCLHLSNFTSEQKLTLLSHFAAIADDLVSRAEEGSITFGAGGGNAWKLPIIVVCAAVLGGSAPASWLTYLSNAQRMIWAENRQIFNVTGADIALPRDTSDGRPRSAYTQQMLGSAEWGEQPQDNPSRNGSNWDAFYRDIVSYSLYPGALAVELTTGGKALWDNPAFWLYMDTVFLRRTEGGAGNTMLAFPLEMTNAYRPAKAAVPAIVDAGIKGAAIWVRFDHALNETATLPSTADFVVNVNGSPVTISNVSIWRQNLGLTLAAAVTGNNIVTLSYTGTTNRVRSVDGVNIANISARALTNRTDKIGGPNAAYPVVRFTPGVVRTLGGATQMHDANTQVLTAALLKFKFDAAPVAESRIFGATAGAISLTMILNTNRTFEVRLQNTSATIICRFSTPALTAGVEYDILFSVDLTQATNTAGANCYVNGVLQTLSFLTYTSGATIGWNVSNALRWNHTGNLNFEFGAFWLDPTARLDLTNSANRAKFTSSTSGNLDILTRGDGITGSIPRHFHVGNADQWNDGSGINRGTGNKFFVTSGLTTLVSGGEWI